MNLFVTASWLGWMLTSVSLAVLVLRQRFQLVKPSTLFLIYFSLQYQLGAALRADWIYQFLPYPWEFFLLTHAFPLIALLVCAGQFRKTARRLLDSVTATPGLTPRQMTVIAALGMLVIGVVGWYLTVVPWGQTGLYAVLFEPLFASEAREESLKLLSQPALRYAVTLSYAVLAPVLGVVLALWSYRLARQGNLPTLAIVLAAMFGLLFAVSLIGARGPGARLILAVILAFFLRRRFPIQPIRLVLAVLVVLTIPALLTLGRTAAVQPLEISQAYLNVIDRAFDRNVVPAIWTVTYGQEHGLIGIAGIPKLAALFGIPPVDVFNLVGTTYRPDRITISANSAFVYGYYVLFGLPAFLLSIVLTAAMDWILLVYRRIGHSLLIPCIAATSVAVLRFTNSFFTSALISGGFLLIPLLCWGLTLIFGERPFVHKAGRWRLVRHPSTP